MQAQCYLWGSRIIVHIATCQSITALASKRAYMSPHAYDGVCVCVCVCVQRIFLSKDFRRQASRFARLGCYGLDPSSLRAGDSHPYTHEGMHEGESERSHAHTVTLASGWRGSSPEALSFWP